MEKIQLAPEELSRLQDQLAQELTQKYGDGTIDMTSGEFTKAG